jgi:predicted metal-dependent hydrolase
MARGWTSKEQFKDRVRQLASKLGVDIRTLTVRSMKKKWASCSPNGVLTFEAELLKFDRKIGDYVIVHELLHCHVPNHGRLCKSLMTAYLGDYQTTERRLRRIATRQMSK